MKISAEAMTSFVTKNYIATGADSTVAEIASSMGTSVAAVRRVIAAEFGCPDGLDCYQEARASYDKNYGTQSGSHRVWMYGPSRQTLRVMILRAASNQAPVANETAR